MLKVLVAMCVYVLCCVMDIHSGVHLNSISSLLAHLTTWGQGPQTNSDWSWFLHFDIWKARKLPHTTWYAHSYVRMKNIVALSQIVTEIRPLLSTSHRSALSLLPGGGRINWPTSLRKVGAQIHTTSDALRYDQDDAPVNAVGVRKNLRSFLVEILKNDGCL